MDCPEIWNGWDENVRVIHGTRQAVRHVLGGCRGIPSHKDLAARTAMGTFILDHNGELLAVEDPPEPRTLGMYTRILALEIDFGWHLRPRYSSVDHYLYWFALARDPSQAKPLKPQETVLRHRGNTRGRIRGQALLYKMDMDDDGVGFENRTLPTASDLDKIQRHLFGRSDLLSRRKCFNLLAKAGCSSHKASDNLRTYWSRHPVDYAKASKVVARAFPELLSGETIVGEDPCAGSSREVVKAESEEERESEEGFESAQEEVPEPEESEESEVSDNDERRERYLNWLARRGNAQDGEEGTDEDDDLFGWTRRERAFD